MVNFFCLSLCMEFMHVSPSVSDQTEVIKVVVQSGEDFSYHDGCGRYALGLTPNPLPTINFPHLSVQDHLFSRS